MEQLDVPVSHAVEQELRPVAAERLLEAVRAEAQ